jgi:4-hydroxy-tetrahydrodipicolinate reductase
MDFGVNLRAPIRVLIHGVSGRMGLEVLSALAQTNWVEPVGGIRGNNSSGKFVIPNSSDSIPLFPTVDSAIRETSPDVMVDFTNADASMDAAGQALTSGVNLVIGTTGLSENHLDWLNSKSIEQGLGVIVAPNFALGAVLLIHLARLVSKHFDHAEIIEAHHDGKIDSPSGTSIAIAEALTSNRPTEFVRPQPERENLPESRGADYRGVSIHSMRLPGKLAQHELTLGAGGQTFSLKHDTVSRECYRPGILSAVSRVMEVNGLMLGLDKVLEL